MELLAGMYLDGNRENSLHYVFRLSKSLYGLKQGSHNWHTKPKKVLLDRDFVGSISHPCVFISKDMIISYYFVSEIVALASQFAAYDACDART